MDRDEMTNIEIFNTVVGLVFADLYESFPVPREIRAYDYAIKLELYPDPASLNLECETPISATFEWLRDEGFIRCSDSYQGGGLMPYTVLTHKGLQLLSVPSAIEKKESLGSEISNAAKKGSLEGLKSLAATAITQGGKLAFLWALQAVRS